MIRPLVLTILITASMANLTAMQLPRIPSGEELQIRPTPVIDAVQKGNETELKNLLLKNFNVNEEDSDKYTPLMRAVQRYVSAKNDAAKQNYLHIITLLLEKKANINAQNRDGFTAIMIAARANNKELVMLLLKYNPDLNLKNNKEQIAQELTTNVDLQRALRPKLI